jgi:large subunit ribosomal protein L28
MKHWPYSIVLWHRSREVFWITTVKNEPIDRYNNQLDSKKNQQAWRTIMSRVCQLTGKKANNAYAVSHSHRRTKKLQEANLQWKRIWWPEGNRFVRIRLSTKAIKTIELKGLAVVAKELGVNLNKF